MNIVASPATRGLSPEVSSTRLSQVDFYLTCRSTCCFHQEIRTQDYLKAYTATGRPPAPVPQEPVGETERAGLGLPPLFQPHVEGGGSDTLSTGPVAEASNPPASPAHQSRIMDHSKLPRIPQFRPVIENDEDTYHNISAMPDYSFFSNEASIFMFYISKIYILSLENLGITDVCIRRRAHILPRAIIYRSLSHSNINTITINSHYNFSLLYFAWSSNCLL